MITRIIWFAMAIIAGSALLSAAEPTAPAAPTTIQLFNGRNLDGLQVFLPDPAADPAKTWWVEDGLLRCSGTPTGYIRTRMSYADYKLHVEWRWVNGKGNSGVLLHIVNRDEIWPKGVEVQLMTERAGDFALFSDARSKEESVGRIGNRASTGRLARPTAQSVEKPLGEWNSYDIVVAGDTITLTVNGVEVNRMTGVAPSGGMIGLQSEGGAIDFRNFTLSPLPPAKDVTTRLPTP